MKIEIAFRALLLLALGMIPNTATASNQDPVPNPKSSDDSAILPQAAQDIENICALLEMPALAMQKTNTPRVSVTTKGGAVLYNPYFLTNAAYWGGPWAPIGLLAREVGPSRSPTDQLPARRRRGAYGKPKSGVRRRVCSWPHGGFAGGGSAGHESRQPPGCESVRSRRTATGD